MKTLRIVTAALVLSTLTGCTVASPDAGHEVVWVMKPIIFGHGGVDPTPVTTGKEYGAMSSDAVDVNMLPQRVDMEFDDMMTSSGVPVSFHVVATFKVIDSVALVSKYGADTDDKGAWGFWSRNVDQPMQNAVRDAVKKHDMQEMAISQTAADSVGQEVQAAAIKIIQQTGVPIVITAINVGRVNPPDAIKNQRIETAAQEQRAITEQQTKLAEDQRKMAEESRASADNAYRNAMQMSPDQYLRLMQINMQRDACGNGNNHCTLILNASGAATILDAR
ncbi:MAG: SPFH domain-containing protein [Acidobacteriaceae bacterium]|jgi:hypothetical protein